MIPYILAAVGISAGITFALRALPFALLSHIRDSDLAHYLAARMPLGMMIIISLYTLRHVDFSAREQWLPVLLAVSLTIALHIWKSNMLLSVGAGTALYVTLMSV